MIHRVGYTVKSRYNGTPQKFSRQTTTQGCLTKTQKNKMSTSVFFFTSIRYNSTARGCRYNETRLYSKSGGYLREKNIYDTKKIFLKK